MRGIFTQCQFSRRRTLHDLCRYRCFQRQARLLHSLSRRGTAHETFSVLNSRQGYDKLFSLVSSFENNPENVKAGLEATGHYSFAILGYLLEKGFACYVFNPLHTNLYRKAVSLRKTKTDEVDSKTIALMLLSSVSLKPYSKALYHNEQLTFNS